MSEENMQEKGYKTEDACNVVGNECLTHTTCEGVQKELDKIDVLRKRLIYAALDLYKFSQMKEALIEFDKLVHFLEETMSYPDYPRNVKKLSELRKLINRCKEEK